MKPFVHETAIIETGVEIGDATSVWDHVHIRGPATRIGRSCIVGEKTHVSYGVTIGDLVKINAFVYVCTAVTIERGAMIAAGVTFTNDRYPRATDSELRNPRPSMPDDETLQTFVGEGATVGARAVIGPGRSLGRFCMVGMAAVVTRDVDPFHLVAGSPATVTAAVCRCGHPIQHAVEGHLPDRVDVLCSRCSLRYRIRDGQIEELTPPS